MSSLTSRRKTAIDPVEPCSIRSNEICIPDRKRERSETRYIVDIPAYASTVRTGAVWNAEATLRNVSVRGLLLELPSAPPFDRGEMLRMSWGDVIVTGQVRHITCRPGFVGISVRLREVVAGSVLACAGLSSSRHDSAPPIPSLVFCSDRDIEQVERAKVVQHALCRAVHVIPEFVPSGSGQASAIRNISEAAMACSVAINHRAISGAER